LPGSGSQQWRGHISFGSIARQQGVGEYWQGGSKLPAIARLLEETLGRRPERFQPLVLSIVWEGLRYREKQGNPLFRSDIDQLNRLIADVGFKFPELSSERFLQSLPEQSTVEPPTEMVGTQSDDATSLDDLKQRLLELSGQLDRPQAGLALESLLADLFALARLAPRGSFQLVGEQIDGSCLLDDQVYLVEAKWTKDPIGQSELLVFHGKVSAKSSITRGLFVSINGFTAPGLEAITRGRQPNSVLMDGADLWQILEGRVGLDDLMRSKVRRLAEEGRVFVPARELFP